MTRYSQYENERTFPIRYKHTGTMLQCKNISYLNLFACKAFNRSLCATIHFFANILAN